MTWNPPEQVEEAVRVLELDKHLMIAKILSRLSRQGIDVQPKEVLYIDDQVRRLGDIRRSLGKVQFLQMWVDISSPREILRALDRADL